MKKMLLVGLLSVGTGFLMGYLFLSEKNSLIKNWNRQEKYYFIEEGIYSSFDNLKNNLSSVRGKVIDFEDNKYYVYFGITKNQMIADKIQDIYQNKGYKVHIIEKYLTSEEFLQNVLQFDNLLIDKNEEEEILTIESVVLANYEEIIKKE